MSEYIFPVYINYILKLAQVESFTFEYIIAK